MRPWQVLEDHVYEEFRIFRIRRSTRLNPLTRKPFSFFLMDGLDWVNVIALTDQDEVVLVKQYRHGAEQATIEIPGGCVEKGEDPRDTVVRELREETGFTVDSVELLGSIHPNPAMQAMRCHCYLARGAKKISDQELDPGEDITVLTQPLSEVKNLIAKGGITHALVIAAFALYEIRPK